MKLGRAVRISGWITALAIAALGVAGCDDSTGNGEGEDTCQGATCGDGFFRDLEDTTPDPDTATPDTTTQPDTSVENCTDGAFECADATTLRTCVSGQWEESLCVAPDVCHPEMGACAPSVCPVPGLSFACESDTQERVCGQDQVSFTVRDCAEGEQCVGTGCATQVCVPRALQCRTQFEPEQCNEDGTAWEALGACAEDERCDANTGQCLSICEAFTKDSTSYEGCEYFVVDMDNESSIDDTEFGVTISNGGAVAQIAATVVITGPSNFSQTVTVEPGDLVQLALPSGSDVDASGVHSNATFYVQSNLPISVHQFNPLNQSGVASNDASLLLPVNALGTDYIALGLPLTVPFEPDAGQETSFYDAVRPYVDIVGTENNTTVTVTSPVPVQGGTGFGNIPANVPTNITVNRGQLIHLLSTTTRNTDLSGMQIMSDKPIAAFAGSRCGSVPDLTSYCDHVEQQLFPTNTWGQAYYAAKFSPRGSEPDLWRIVAAENDTIVTFTPPQNGTTTVNLARGEVFEMLSTENFKVTADKPILVGQFMTGSNYPGIPMHDSCIQAADIVGLGSPCDEFLCLLSGGTCVNDVCGQTCSGEAECDALCPGGPAGQDCRDQIFCHQGACSFGTGIGDPAYSLAVPADQYRIEYIVMVPSGYEENYMNLIATTGTVPRIDGIEVSGPPYNATPMSINGERDVYRIRVGEGVHRLTSTQGTVGVSSYGYACDVSYAYPGGLDLEIIN